VLTLAIFIPFRDNFSSGNVCPTHTLIYIPDLNLTRRQVCKARQEHGQDIVLNILTGIKPLREQCQQEQMRCSAPRRYNKHGSLQQLPDTSSSLALPLSEYAFSLLTGSRKQDLGLELHPLNWETGTFNHSSSLSKLLSLSEPQPCAADTSVSWASTRSCLWLSGTYWTESGKIKKQYVCEVTCTN